MRKLVHSVKCALQGIIYLIRTQRNAQFHIFSSCVAIGFGIWLNISFTEWAIVSICITAVLGAEAFNTSIEKICDTLHPEIHPKIKTVKDVSAGAVLIISLGALAVGLIIYLPKFLHLIHENFV